MVGRFLCKMDLNAKAFRLDQAAEKRNQSQVHDLSASIHKYSPIASDQRLNRNIEFDVDVLALTVS